MKKGFLFGLGVLIAGGVLAATISTVSIDNKTPGDTVTNQEFNSITSGIGEVTDTFNGTTSDATSITIPKDISATKVSAPEVCLAGDCQTAWPAGGAGDNLGDYVVLQDLLPEMTGATPLGGSPTGSPAVVSTRNIGSETQWFSNLWVEDLHVGNQSLYMNGVKILESDPTVEMRFTADNGQKMSISTKGSGAEMSVKSEDNLNIEVTPLATEPKSLNITNNSTDGTIDIATASPKSSNPNAHISLQSSNIFLGGNPLTSGNVGINYNPLSTTPAYTLDVNGDINFTGDLYQNGVAFSGGGCIDYQYSKCVGDKIYWYNSCDQGDFTNPKEDCTSLGGCTTGEIGGTCANSASGGEGVADQSCGTDEFVNGISGGTFSCASVVSGTEGGCEDYYKAKCVSGDIYWYDSCGVIGTKKEECGALSCSTSSHACNKDIASLPGAPTNVQYRYPNGGFCLASSSIAACSMAKITWSAPSTGAPITKYILEFYPDNDLLLGPPITELLDEANYNVNSAAFLPNATKKLLSTLFPTAFAQIANRASWESPGTIPSSAATSISDLVTKIQNGTIKSEAEILKSLNSSITRVVSGDKLEYIMLAGDIPEGRWKVRVSAVNAIGVGPTSTYSSVLGIINPSPSPVGLGLQEEMLNYSNDAVTAPF